MADRVELDYTDSRSIADLKRALEAKLAIVEDMPRSEVEYATRQGEQLAKEYLRQFLGRSSSMEASIGSTYDAKENIGTIFVNHEGAPYVEYGTGMIGESHPHPTGGAPGGFHDRPWVYFKADGRPSDENFDPDKGRLFVTFGQRSKPFMYSTWQSLSDMIQKRLKAKR